MGIGSHNRKGAYVRGYILDSLERVQPSRPLDAANSTQKGRHAAAMRAVATNSEATCYPRRVALRNCSVVGASDPLYCM